MAFSFKLHIENWDNFGESLVLCISLLPKEQHPLNKETLDIKVCELKGKGL